MEPVSVEERRAQAEKLINGGYYADALMVLEGIERDRSPDGKTHVQWARQQTPIIKAALKKSRAECQDAYRLAGQLFEDCKYAEAVEILEKFKRGSRSAQAEELLKEAKRILKKITKLNEDIDRAIYKNETETDEFFDLIESLLELDPKDRRARQLHQKLEAERHTESHLGWRLGLAAMVMICLVAVGWVCKLVFWPSGEGTITIKLTRPELTVHIDGVPLAPSDLDTKLDRYKPGDHRLELRRGIDVVARHTFTIEANLDKTLEVPGNEVVLNETIPPAETLPLEEVPEPNSHEQPVVRLDPEPMPMPMPEPEPEPMVIGEQKPVPKTEPTRINGFPIAKQIKYVPLIGPAIQPRHAVFSQDARLVAAERMTSDPADPQKTYDVLVWDTTTGETVQTFTLDAGELQGLAMSPDGNLLAAALVNSPDPEAGIVQIWSVETGALVHALSLSPAPAQTEVLVKGVAFSFDGKLVGIINQNAVSVWTLSDGTSRFQRSFAPSNLTSIGFFPLSEIVVVGTTVPGGGADGVLSWDMKLNTQRGVLPAGRSEAASHPAFAVSPDLSVMTVMNENSLRRYATQNQQLLDSASLPEFLGETQAMKAATYSPSGQYVMASVPGRRPLIWRDSDFTRIAILGELSSVGSFAVRFTPDSKSVMQLDNPDENDFSAGSAVIRAWEIEE